MKKLIVSVVAALLMGLLATGPANARPLYDANGNQVPPVRPCGRIMVTDGSGDCTVTALTPLTTRKHHHRRHSHHQHSHRTGR